MNLKKIAATLLILFLISNLCVWASQDDSVYFKTEEFIPDIETFMQIGYASQKCFSPDGETIYFTNSFSEISQLYRISEKEPYPYQLTFMKNGISYPTMSPDGKWIIFLADQDGNEQYQLYLMDAKTGRFEPLTNKPMVRYGTPVWANQSAKIYFRANLDNPQHFNIYEMDLNTRKIKPLVVEPGYFGPSVISKDDRYLIYYEYKSNVNVFLSMLDLETGKKKLLNPHKGDVLSWAVTISGDNRTLYYVTNDNPDGILKLSAMNIETGESKIIYDPDSPWGVDDAYTNPRRDKITFIVNENGYGNMKIMDLKTMELLPAPKLGGVVDSASMSRSSKICFTYNDPVRPTDVYTWDWVSKELNRVTYSSLAGIDPDLFVEPKLVHYKSFDGLEIPAFLFLPPGYENKMGDIPFIIHFHGGPEGQTRPYFQRHFNYLLLNGFGILAPNIRGSKGYGKKYKSLDDYKKRMDSVKDGYQAALYLIKEGYTKKGRIGVKGGSYGGFMVMALITEYPDMWGAAYESVGIVDFVNFLKNTKPYRRKLREAEYGPLSDEEFLKSVSPIHKIDRVQVPLMISHGVNDPRVPVSEARLIVENLKGRDIDVKALLWEDEGHGVSKKKNRLVLYREMADFFKEHLTGE